ncbi:MAG: lipoyl(octanoyl) transferase LipB [Caulobacter sp.]|nr:lipoyl(octanoyl) transferase LipB [Caulobacter sp.]
MLDQPLNPAAPAALFGRADAIAAGWAVSTAPVPYLEAVAAMEARAAAIAEGTAGELVWLLEHPPLYTAGVSARDSDLIDPDRFPVFASGRGGQYTYHGPGQRVAYLMLDLTRRGRDVRAFVAALEAWVIDALAAFNVEGGVRDGRVGVWVERKGPGWSREDKIAAIGVKLRRWVSFHGISLNVEPDLSHFDGIVPCGQTGHGVTSLVDLGLPVTMDEADAALKAAFVRVFGPVEDADAPSGTVQGVPAGTP